MHQQDETYHTEFESVYHVLRDCPLGRRIPAELREPGTGGRALCFACEARLSNQRRDDSPP
jgi:hypothetical protein